MSKENLIRNVALDMIDDMNPDPTKRIKTVIFTQMIVVPLEEGDSTLDKEGKPRTHKQVPLESWIYPLDNAIAHILGERLCSDIILGEGIDYGNAKAIEELRRGLKPS